MKTLRRHIGSLAALFAFEAAARLGGFTRAAIELGVSQAAVSKQVQQLEADLGRTLFHRAHRRATLTEDGRALFGVASRSLGDIARTMAALRSKDQMQPTVIVATLAMSHFWLIPRIPAFNQSHPDLPVRIISQDDMVDLRSGIADMTIRFGGGDWPDGTAQHMFDSEIYPLASPDYLARHAPIHDLDGMLRHPLIAYDLHDETWVGWTEWLAACGKTDAKLSIMLHCTRVVEAMQAAVMGQGIVLGWAGLTGGLEERGLLKRVVSAGMRPRGGVYLVTRQADALSAHARALADWLMLEATRIDADVVTIGAAGKRIRAEGLSG
jgi:DNA-binding transcriptional LysR family regulator